MTVVTTSRVAEIICSREATGRIARWAMELQPYGFTYTPRNAIKA
jgi:hypothetical protein